MERFIFALLFVWFGADCFGDDLKPPELTPSLINQEERAILDEGIALHDQARYDEAIQKYKQVLKKNPANIVAQYEIAYSYFASGKFEESIAAAREGARYKSKYLSQFYTMIGNSLDELGKTDEAISVFNQAVQIAPDDAMLRFNFAVTLTNSGKTADAPAHLKAALRVNPKHASSHYALGQLYYSREHRVLSILALLRFLTLEPRTERSRKALAMVDENLQAPAKKSKDYEAKDVQPQTDEEDLQNLDLMLSPSHPGKKPTKDQTSMRMRIDSFNKLFSIMAGTQSTEKTKDLIDLYFPYFAELKKEDLVVPFTYYIYQSADPEAARWVKEQGPQVERFVEWSDGFGERK